MANKTYKTLVDVIKDVASRQHKDRAGVVKDVLETAKRAEFVLTSIKTPVTEKNTTTLLNAMVRDITGGKKQIPRNGWWSTFKVLETDTAFKFEKQLEVIKQA